MSANNVTIEKLHGSANYHTWKFAMQNLLDFSDMNKCITDPVTETDESKLRKAKAKIVLSIDESLYSHIRSETTALAIWKKLQKMFGESNGLLRGIGVLRKLSNTKIEDCETVADYVGQITDALNKLCEAGFEVCDKLQGGFFLAGLSDRYEPFIMGIDGSGIALTADSVSTKLLDGDYGTSDNQSAFYGKKKNSKSEAKIKSNRNCYKCGKKGHYGSECSSKDKPKTKKSAPSDSKSVFSAVFLSRDSQSRSTDWYLDSGASCHMTPNKNWLLDLKKSPISEIVAANNDKMPVNGTGSVKLRLNENEIEVKEVLHVPNLTTNLLSVAKIVQNGNTVIFDKSGCKILNNRSELIAESKPSAGVYKFSSKIESCFLASAPSSKLVTWHRRLGHINYVDLCKMKNGAVDGISFSENPNILSKCEVCLKGKQTRKPFTHTGTRAKGLLELIHSDLCGPMEKSSLGGAKYFLTFIDDFSRKVFVYLLKSKADVLDMFKVFKQLVENQTGKKIKMIRTDNGTEYVGQNFDSFCKQWGIVHQTSNTYTPQQNGVAERMNRTICERAKCMLFDAELDKAYWGEAVNTAAYVINRSISSSLQGRTPEGIWTGSNVDLSALRIFGSPVMVHVPKQRRLKWDAKSRKLIFVGYSETTKGYRCVDPATKKIVISRDIVFMENEVNNVIAFDSDDIVSVGETQTNASASTSESGEAVTESIPATVPVRPTDDITVEPNDEEDVDFDDALNATMIDPLDATFVPNIEATPPASLRRSERAPKQIDFESQGYVTHLAIADNPENDPLTVDEAMKRSDIEQWKEAMQGELASLAENKTWTFSKLPSGRKAVKSKWVFKTKRDDNGNIIRYKARLVAKGCSQTYGIDYSETFSPVVRYTSIRYLIALSVKLGLKIDQMDAVTAFLQGDLSEDIYMELPTGCGPESGRVCKLNKAIYGLKQSGRQWNLKLEATLKSFGLLKSRVDPCVYHTANCQLIIAIYVDDILIFWKNAELRDQLKSALSNAFKMKDMGTARSCVGFNITYDDSTNGIWLDQTKYTKDILTKFGMSECKPVSTPSDTNQKLSMEMCKDSLTNVPYQEAVGSLLYLAQGTRPDIAFAVNDVSRFNSNHGQAHWTAVKRIFRYLKATTNYKLLYSGSESLAGFSDADWASDVDKRRSCTGYVFTLCGGAISWGSKRQPTVALSSTEAEYMAMSSAVQEAFWLKQFGQNFDPSIRDQPISIACDNQSALALAETDCFRARSKHIDVRHHFIRDRIADRVVAVSYISTEKMVADNLTKAVPSSKHLFCCDGMGLSIKN